MQVIQAARVVRDGGVVAYPTEAVFGLGCDPWNADAVARILTLKHRPQHQGLVIVAADVVQLRDIVRPLPPLLADRVLATWPGPVTWLLPARPGLPRWLRGRHRCVAVRVSAHPLVAELCRRFGGPLVSTSANRAGGSPCRDAHCVRRLFATGVDFVLPGALGDELAPSRIVDGASGTVVRD